ncbi:hypothetical protein FQR65_LT13000 [Abscondita terminalis]|nr:hypothetical protein FQR65_LT13000 [Abscondita terminalis]
MSKPFRYHPRGSKSQRKSGKPTSKTGNDCEILDAPSTSRGGKSSTENPKRQNFDERKQHFSEMVYKFKKLEELSNKEPTAIVLDITAHENAFENLIKSELSNDAIVLLVKTLANVCLADIVKNKVSVMNLACKDTFHESIKKFVFYLILHSHTDRKNSYFWKDPEKFFKNLATLFQSLLECMPSRACEVLPKTIKACTVSLKSLSGDDFDTKPIIDLFEKLESNIELHKLSIVNSTKNNEKEYDEVNNPPDDFRQLNVYPTKNEILFQPEYLPKNLVNKSYRDVDHYLDVQFRLLKEDFVGPLRKGITEYLRYTGPPKPILKIFNVRIYTNVKCIRPYLSRDQMGMLVQFEDVTKRKYKFNTNKAFMFGSLLCFSRDNFKTLLFGKVVERTDELLEKGQVIVGMEKKDEKPFLGQSYVMIESLVYFEPYYHVLNALQKKTEEEFAMKKYIVDLNTQVEGVSYLNCFNLMKSADVSQLNASQFEAYKAALLNEFVIIQGPPGTGKTFVGAKIVNTLIMNKKYWHNLSPMLIICYTNHALDQFLEHLITTTDDIVRIGNRSKNKNLAKFSLYEKRITLDRNLTDITALKATKEKLSECLIEINIFSRILNDIESNSVIINFRNFFNNEDNVELEQFCNASDQEMIDWLLGGTRSNKNRLRNNEAELKEFEDGGKANTEDHLEKEYANILYQEWKNRFSIDDDVFNTTKSNKNHILTSVSKLQQEIRNIQIRENNNQNDDDEKELQHQRLILENQVQYLQKMFNKYRNIKVHRKPSKSNLENIHKMNKVVRWELYLYWLENYKNRIRAALLRHQKKYMNIQEQHNEIQDYVNLDLMQRMTVVGMTTTAAARYQNLLINLKCPIVVVEEAAEILESHVVVSLTSHCKHLILIGDHQQLRPSTSNYNMEKNYNLGISLFERMISNQLQCHVLDVQHRMRPEIANLIRPTIYPKLDNHPSVYDFPSIAGVVPNLYFIDHKFEEKETNDSSKINEHEAKFLIAFARYLIQNGYKPNEVTILAAYSGQMFVLWKEQQKCSDLIKDVRITVLDNYQGEESKIILLSLVRNNKEGKIGFLKIENRVCVALSRAREGLYIMGNMDLLCENSEIWPKVRDVLETQESLGPSLMLRCQIHREHETIVTVPDDFEKVIEGGCNTICAAKLHCGHNCPMVCHIFDREHETFKCTVSVIPTLTCGHQHQVPCHNVNVFKCPTPVETKLPCGHTDSQKPCHLSVELHKCPFPCDTRVEPCGHACSKKCHFMDDPDHDYYKCQKPCQRAAANCSTGNHKCLDKCYELCAPCKTVIEKRMSCTHKVSFPCHQNPSEAKCIEKCKRLLPCGHACKMKCGDPCGYCEVMVKKEVSKCKHIIEIECSRPPTTALCAKKCPLLLPCGHKCQNFCKEDCTIFCKVLVDHDIVADCGHVFKITCYMKRQRYASNSFRLLKFCISPCRKVLICGHICSGTCGECAQGRIHKPCSEKCGAVLVCGHPCSVDCREECQPCPKSCSYKCSHSSCKRKCGEPCTPCVEKCARKCSHAVCAAMCGDICTIPPCNEACPKKLPCDHSCIGFCGDPCPPLCRICNRDEVTEIFFGNEADDGARFVVLNECGHVLESDGMDLWLKGDVNEQDQIAPKCCPRCRTILTSTQRFSDYIKKSLRDVTEVKIKYFGTKTENDAKYTEITNKMKLLKRNRLFINNSMFFQLLNTFEKALHFFKVRRRQSLGVMQLSSILAKLQIIENIAGATAKLKLISNSLQEQLDFLYSMLLRNKTKLTRQEIVDFDKEVKRWSIFVQISQIEHTFSIYLKDELFHNTLEKCKQIVQSIQVFNVDLQEDVDKHLHGLKETYGAKISSIELKNVISAMRMAKGHWYKCPNGHVYAIGECGGAMQIGKCADCGATIGGTNHALLSSNAHAPEVDGSRHPAYSEAANNLQNYENFRNFF